MAAVRLESPCGASARMTGIHVRPALFSFSRHFDEMRAYLMPLFFGPFLLYSSETDRGICNAAVMNKAYKSAAVLVAPQ